MKAPSITKGPWAVGDPTPMRPTYTIYHKPFGLGDIAEVDGDRPADAQIMAAAPMLAGALLPFAGLLQDHNSKGSDEQPIFGINDITITRKHLRDAVAALKAAGYTED